MGPSVAELEEKRKKDEEPKKSRFERRVEERYKTLLDNIVMQFFTARSKHKDPNGDEVASLFSGLKEQWKRECTKHNKTKSSVKLRYQAFEESVNHYLEIEKQNMVATEIANKTKDFEHWFRRAHVWKTRPLTMLQIEFKALFRKEKVISLWKDYYLTKVMN